MRLIKSKGFTLIELLVTIAVLGILVLLGAPRFTSHIQEAELTRIQHDVRVMEEEMKIILLENEKIEGFDYNTKDLGLLIEANRLFEKEGHAEVLEYVPAKGEINGLNNKEQKISSKANVGGVEYSTYGGFGAGGDEIQIGEEFKEMYERYKIVPDEYTDKIKTRLKGTFYTNDNGKVYYEPDKPNKIKEEPKVLNCDVALPDYEFEPSSGKIVKYTGTEQHLIIPSHFLVDDECVPVRIIGEGAFMQGGFKSIMIPPSVLVIERNAFKESGVDSITIPGSVIEIGQGAFDGIEDVVYLGGPSRVNNGTGAGTYLTPDGSSKNVAHRHPSAGEASVVFHPESGTIIRGPKGPSAYIPEYINVGSVDIKVRKVAKGAYQGLGLITVVLPETLEVIEDYAFSGNQLIGVTIPNSVYHIGHYAFSFNEVWHEDNENDRKATIKTVIIKEEEQFNKIDKIGNIVKDGVKVDLLEASSSALGPNVKLLNHIWVTSIGNIVIDVQYGPVGSGDEIIPDNYEMAELEDFEFVPNSSAPNEYHGNRGYYRYVGDKEYVVIPHIIQDVELKDYYKMFEGSSVKGVASDNKNVTDMSLMFYGSVSTSIELKHLDTSSVTNMASMFYNSKAATLDLSSFDTSSVTNMEYMFNSSRATTLDLSSFNTSKVTNMVYMFRNSQATTLDLSSFDTSSVINMASMFNNSKATILDLSSFDTSSVINMASMFRDSQATTGYARTTADAGKFNTTDLKPSTLTFVVKGDLDKPQPPTNKPDGYVIAKQEDFRFVVSSDAPNTYNGTKGYYTYVGKDDKIVIPHIIHGNEIKDYYKMFNKTTVKGVASDNKNVTNMSLMFYNSASTSIELKYLDTSSVTNMNRMFYNSKASTLNLSSFDTSSVTSMYQMFLSSQATTLDLSSFDTSKVTNMTSIFSGAQATKGYARTATDAGKFNTSDNKPSTLTFIVKQ